jgi:steroid delta-isomerase-like uncharacterized protein
MSEKNKTLVRRLYEDAVNKHDLEASRELCSRDYIHHDPSLPGVDIRGLDKYLQTISVFFTAFPDIHIDVQDLIAEGDKVVARWTWSGTHKGELMGMGPTGKRVSVNAISIHRVAGGKLAEGWVVFDALGMMQQLGVAPGPATGG